MSSKSTSLFITMNRIIFTISTLFVSSMAVLADPTPEIKPVSNLQGNVLSVLDERETSLYTGDVYMPTLEEMLGEPVDNLGDIADNQWLKDGLVDYAKNYIGTRYRHGAKGPNAFDCSGFTSYVFRKFGYQLSPASRMQGTQGEHVDLANVEVGDLMFFSGRRGGSTVGHVGMVVDVDRANGTLKFIHASTKRGVVIQNYPDGAYYSRHFLHARRVIDVEQPISKN